MSVGSDKAIVVWDWRTGTKVVRFGQQTNVCVGMNLLDNFIITATVDGVIRTFSIAKREMIGQFKISDMAARHPQVAEKLKEVGVGALGMLNWFTAEGRFLAVSNRVDRTSTSYISDSSARPRTWSSGSHGTGPTRRNRPSWPKASRARVPATLTPRSNRPQPPSRPPRRALARAST